MRKSANLIDIVKSGARSIFAGAQKVAGNVIVYCAVTVGALGATAEAYEPIPIEGFKDFTGGASIQNLIETPSGNDLRKLNTVVPGAIVESGSHWHMGFINYVEASPTDPNLVAKVVGYAENRWSDYPGGEGFITGDYTVDLGIGNRPDDIWIIHDQKGNGLGTYRTGGWFLGDDDVLYYAEDVMFGSNKIYGDVSQLPSGFGILDLPQMEVDVRSSRSTSAGLVDLANLAENWLKQDCHPYDNMDCDGADWNYDGRVDMEDFGSVSENWEIITKSDTVSPRS